MAFALHDLPGGQPIAETSTTQKHPLGTRVRATDPSLGEAEFIYLKGVASTVVGSVALFDQKNGTTTLTVAASRGPVAVSMSANVASQFGWYAVAGAVPVKAVAALGAGVRVATSAVAGQVGAVALNQVILGMVTVTAEAGGLADSQLNHPVAGETNA